MCIERGGERKRERKRKRETEREGERDKYNYDIKKKVMTVILE